MKERKRFLWMDSPIGRSVAMILVWVMTLTALVLFASYAMAKRQIQRTAFAQMQRKVEEAIQLLDLQFVRILADVNVLSNDSTLRRMRYYRTYDTQKQINLTMEAQELLRRLTYNPMVDRVYYHDPSQDLVISSEGVMTEAQSHGLVVQGLQVPSNAYNAALLSHQDAQGVWQYYVARAFSNRVQGSYLCARVRPQNMVEQWTHTTLFAGEKTLLLDAQHRLMGDAQKISHADWQQITEKKTGAQVTLDGMKYWIVRASSNQLGWEMVLLAPYSYVTTLMLPLRWMLLCVFALALLLGIAFCTPLVRRMYSPIDELYEQVTVDGQQRKLKHRIQYLNETFAKLMYDNGRLRSLAEQSLPLLQQKFLLQCLMQPDLDSQYMQEQMTLLKIPVPQQRFRVAILAFVGAQDEFRPLDALKAELYREYIASELFLSMEWIAQLDMGRYALLLEDEGDDPQKIYRRFKQLLHILQAEMGITPYAGVSSSKTELPDLSLAFSEANRCTLAQAAQGDYSIAFYETMNLHMAAVADYPYPLEEAIRHALRAGDRQELEVQWQALTLYLQRLTAGRRQVLMRMYNSIYQLLLELGEDALENRALAEKTFLQLNDAQDVVAQMDILSNFGTQVLELLRRASSGRRSSLVEQAMTFMEGQYMRPLSVQDIADAVHISAPYLYRLMRDEVGKTPADTLSQIRITHAAQALRETDWTIEQICEACGFESKQAFYRNFKKYYASQPMQYRQQNSQ